MSQMSETVVLAPFEIWEVMLDNSTIKFHKPLILTPKKISADENFWVVEEPELGLSAFGNDCESLWDCVQSCIRMQWKEYVCEDNGNLLPLAKKYKDAYLAIAGEVDE